MKQKFTLRVSLLALLVLLASVAHAQRAPKTRGKAAKATAAVYDSVLYNGLRWRSIGPYRGGRAGTVTGVPGNPNLYYMGTAGGGVWRTTDGGGTWGNITDKYFGGSIGAVAVSESDPNVIYAGQGEQTVRGNVSSGFGVWKSQDAGKTWANIGLKDSVGMAHGDVSWAWWPMGGAWLVTHFARHLEFGWDQKFARDRAWPAAAGCAAFLLSWIERRTDGTLGTPIATSPENNFVLSDGARGSVAAASTMDLALIRDVFRLVQDLDKRLALNSPIARRCAESLPQLLAPPMDPDGRIREWPDGFPDWEPHHRHVSHLYGLYPGVERWTDQLREGARKSLDSRGNDASGWSLTWKLALRARLGQSNVVQQLLRLFFRTPDLSKNDSAGSLQPNLLQTSPPFQIDANLGLVGALAEMFVQSHLGVIELLPALPSTFTSGAVRGLVARPGVIVDFGWAAGRLTFATLTSRQDVDVRVDWPGGGAHLRLLAGDSTALKIGS